MASIDLNCDMGEGYDRDAEIMPLITSVNIACGAHAGSAETMKQTVRLALAHRVAIGAHPGLPDRANFGRKELPLTPTLAYQLVHEQVSSLTAIAHAEGAWISHVKPHGALYNMAAKNSALAQAVADAVQACFGHCFLVGLAGSELIKAGERPGLTAVSEAFADRNYESDGSLTPRDQAEAIIHDPVVAAERVLRMVSQGSVTSRQGTEVPLRADTICVHGDSPGATELAKAIRDRLQREGIEVKSFARY